MTALETRVISQANFQQFLETLLAERPVMGPQERRDQPGFFHFDWLDRAGDFAPDYPTTTIPPKKAFAGLKETLFTFTLDSPPQRTHQMETFPFVLLGVHPCDLSGLDALDRAYSQPPAEVRWAANRKRALVVGLDCRPDPYCFCGEIGTESWRAPCDLFLTPLPEGYLVEIHSESGRSLLKAAETAQPRPADWKAAEEWRTRKVAGIVQHCDAPPEQLREILAKGGLTPVWKEVAERCYGCGSCNTTCPTCFCFDMVDEIHPGLDGGARYRTWDSCQLPDFAVVASGHNFRGERWRRVRHRWQRKFLYLYRQFDRPYCTGCGRCSRACTADINIVDVGNQLIGAAPEET